MDFKKYLSKNHIKKVRKNSQCCQNNARNSEIRTTSCKPYRVMGFNNYINNWINSLPNL